MIFNWIIDHIPLWVWIVVALASAGAAFYFLSPILIPLWKITPKPVKLALGAIIGAAGFYLGGRYRGRANAEEEARRRDAAALQTRKEVDDAVAKLPEGEASKRLHDRWSRD